jgi:rare lipoprotein A
LLKSLKSLAALALLFSAISPGQAAARQCTVASHYGVGDGYHGRTTANGERFDAYGVSAAHPNLPFGSQLLVFNPNNGKTVVVKVNDRGPYVHGRGIDLSYGAFSRIASPGQGVATICYSRVV